MESGPETDIINITGRVEKIVAESGISEGTANVFVEGSTASVSVIEFEQDLIKDMKAALERLAPSGIKYWHKDSWGSRKAGSGRPGHPYSNAKSHVLATLMGPDITVPVAAGRPVLGAWQQIVVLDFDIPARKREIIITVIGE